MITWLFTRTPLLFLAQSFWRDEAFSYFMAKKSIIDMIFLTAKDFNPPLYYFILHYWMNIFGGSEIALRSLSLIFFVGTLYVVYLLMVRILKIKDVKATLYLLLFIINPILIYYAFEARMYSMLAFFATLSYYAFLKKNNLLYILATIAGLFTHYFMVLVVLSQILVLLKNKKNIEFVKIKVIKFSLICFSPWFLFFLFQNKLESGFWIDKPHLKDLPAILGIIYTGNESAFYPGDIISKIQNNLIMLSFILMIIVIYGIFLYAKKFIEKDRHIFQILFLWGIGIPLFVGLISFVKPIYFPRYLIFTSVGLILLAIFIAEKVPVILKIALLTLLIFSTLNYQKLQIDYRKKTNYIQITKQINLIKNKNDLIYVDDLDYFTALYYFKDNVFIYGKSYQEIPAYNGKTLIPKEQVALNPPAYPQKAYILQYDGKYSIESMN